MNELQIFKNNQFGTVRTITKDGKTLFCRKDIAVALGYKRPVDAIKAHCKESVIRRLPIAKITTAVQTHRRWQSMPKVFKEQCEDHPEHHQHDIIGGV